MTEVETQDRIDDELEPRPEVVLVGTDGNAFALMGKVSQALRRAGASNGHVNAFRKEAMSGDYDHLLATCCKFAEVC